MESEDIRAARETLKKLPDYCFAYHPVTNLAVKIVRGIAGYTALDTFMDPAALNESLGVSQAQAAAMFAGSMFGWHTRAADPEAYTAEGRPRVTGRSALHPSRGDRCSRCGAPMAHEGEHVCASL
jgi:hypothetical protein